MGPTPEITRETSKSPPTAAHGAGALPAQDVKHDDDQQDLEPQAKKPPQHATLHDALHDLKDSGRDLFHTARYKAIQATPGFIVNNSSNILGAAHVATEIAMFKASIPDEKLVPNAKNPIDYVVKAVKRVYVDSFHKSGADAQQLREVFRSDRPLKNFIKYVRDVDAATDHEINRLRRQKGAEISRQSLRLGNPWQTRSTLSGLTVWALSALIPDKKEKPEEVERMTILHDTNLPGYLLERVRQAVWVPEWPEHKRQMIGLGLMASSICSGLGAWRNNVKIPTGGFKYELNKGVLGTSALMLSASMPLLFASDNEKGFGSFGTLMMGRIPFLFGSIKRKYQGDVGAAHWYTGSMVSFQAENLTQALIGGAKKLPDGTIIDYEEIKRNAHQEARDIKIARYTKRINEKGEGKEEVGDTSEAASLPKHHVTQVSNEGRALDTRTHAAAVG